MIHLEKVTRSSSSTVVAEPVEGNSHLRAGSSREKGPRERAHDLSVIDVGKVSKR